MRIGRLELPAIEQIGITTISALGSGARNQKFVRTYVDLGKEIEAYRADLPFIDPDGASRAVTSQTVPLYHLVGARMGHESISDRHTRRLRLSSCNTRHARLSCLAPALAALETRHDKPSPGDLGARSTRSLDTL
jgi:hypothetical protein